MNISRMGRGVLLFALLLALFALVTPPQKATHKSNETSGQDVATSRQGSTVVEQEVHASEYQRPCRKHQENRSSDLCAQWKAADAAESAANAAWYIGLAGAFLGFLTLIVAVKAALYARDAATHTEAGSKTARDALAHQRHMTNVQLRAYVDLDEPALAPAPGEDTEGSIGYKYKITFRNFGSTPASKFIYRSKILVKSEAAFGDVESEDWSDGGSIAPGDHFWTDETFSLKRADIERIRHHVGIAVFCVVGFEYNDVFGDRHIRHLVLTNDEDMAWAVDQESEHTEPKKD